MFRVKVALLGLIVIAVVSPGWADIADQSWVFAQAGDPLGWSAGGDFVSSGVDAGYWWGETGGTNPYMVSSDYLDILALPNHYISLKMRMRLTSSPTDRFGPTDAEIWWGTNANPNPHPDRKVAFKTYGNAAWKVYNIVVGDHVQWTGTIRRLRIDPCSIADARVAIAWIKVMRDITPPAFSAENMWTYADGEVTNDSTPTVGLREYYDEVFGIDRAEFYYRPGASTSEDDWVLDGTDSDAPDGYQYTYSALADGTYDLGVKVYDNAGNAGYWAHGDDQWIDDLTVDSTLATRIDIDAAAVVGSFPKGIFGNNVLWWQWSDKYDAATGRLPDNLEDLIERMGVTTFRYATGDTFYWKLSIGPVEQRPSMYDLNTNSYRGPAVFGLDEVLRWCEQRSIEPLLTCRFRWPGGPPAPVFDEPDPYPQALADAIDLVEYCNSPNDGSNPNGGTDWAAQRAANGHPEPYNVKLFEIGNEPWGFDPYGSPGNYGFDGPSEYSLWFLKYLEGMTAVDPTIKVSLTSHTECQLDFDPADPGWAHSVYEQAGSYVDYVQIHPYLPYSAWQTDLVKLYEETMATPKALDDVFCNHRTSIILAAPEKIDTVKLRLTEWDINYNWRYDPAEGRINTYHTKTLKAAIALADAFRVFIENRDLIECAQWWSLYKNGAWSCIAGDDATVYPAYHAFRIFNRHFGDEVVQSEVIGSPTFDYIWGPGSILKSQLDLAYLTAIASKSADGSALYLVVINKDRLDAQDADVNVTNFLSAPYTQVEAEIWELKGPDVDDYNNPSAVTIAESVATYDPSFTYSFPAHSVTSFKFTAAPVSPASIGGLKTLPEGSRIQIADKVVTGVFPPDALYIEEDDRSSGIRVSTSDLSASEGNRATVVGTIELNANGERYIAAETITHDSSAVTVDPLGAIQRASVPPTLDMTGLLVTIFGWTGGSSADSFYVSDGSGLLSETGNSGVKVCCSSPPGDGRFVIATGIRSQEIPPGGTTPEPVILTRTVADVHVML